MTLEILSARTDQARWRDVLSLMPYDVRDVHFTAEYGLAQEMLGDGYSSHMAAYTSPDGWMACQAFLRRPLENGYCDITAIGYGGPIANDTLPSLAHGDEYQTEWEHWMRGQNVVSEFCLFNPAFEAAQGYLTPQRDPEKLVVLLPVRPETDVLAEMRRDRRRDAKRVDAAEVSMGTTIDFAADYAAMSGRQSAAARWRFPADYFAALPLSVVISAPGIRSLILFGNDVAYYHLTATSPNMPRGANERVILRALHFAREHHCSWLHLGGGVTNSPDDPLLDFKRSFGGVCVPCYSYRRVINPWVYEKLSGGEDTGFFPAYRAKEAE